MNLQPLAINQIDRQIDR